LTISLVQIVDLLKRQGRVSYRALKMRFNLDDEYLDVLKEELSTCTRCEMMKVEDPCGLAPLKASRKSSLNQPSQHHSLLHRHRPPPRLHLSLLPVPVYHWFTEGFDTADLKDAKALLEDLRA
jgi:hypothetical protein